ncbi:MAG TPA: LacI family DNA-binding transcriptional regulator, partial [Rhodanobacteraceae bacterium]|nr:LacI family DNA-binding transcriptional regulator [Rhodanobacteraceae bacterium]
MPSRTPRKQADTRRKPQAAARAPKRGPARMVPSGSDGQATINDIARLAGVSKKTVSRVI